MSEVLTIESFQPHLGTGFTVHTDEHVETFTLTEVTPGKTGIPGGRAPFSLVFDGSSKDLMFHSQLLHFRHDAMGELTFMVSPIGRRDEGGFRYEAVFN